MTPTFAIAHRPLSRRTFLRGAGVTLARPFLDAMIPLGRRGCQVPRRMVAIETNMGILPQFFFPKKTGREYESTPYLEKLAADRNIHRVLGDESSRSHRCPLPPKNASSPARRIPDAGGFRNWVSLDQFAAEQIGNRTRYPSLVLAMSEGATLSYTRSGAPIPSERAQKTLPEAFVQGKPEEVAANVEALKQGRSMLDFVGEQSKRLNRSLSKGDRQRMDQYSLRCANWSSGCTVRKRGSTSQAERQRHAS